MKVSELEGAELDYWVSRANNFNAIICTRQNRREFSLGDPRIGQCYIRLGGPESEYSPSTKWGEGGPIMEREKIHLFYCGKKKLWFAADKDGFDIYDYYDSSYIDTSFCQSGSTVLIAAMRCFVVSKFGDEINERKSA